MRGILQRPEEQSRTGSCQGSSVAGQPQCPRLWHSSTPNARFLSHSPSAPPPPFTQSPYPPRSLVRDGQTHPHRPRLVVSHSTCPPLSSSPHAHSFVIGPAVIKHTRSIHTKPLPSTLSQHDAFDPALSETFFSTTLGFVVPVLSSLPATTIVRVLSAASKNTSWTFMATTPARAQLTQGIQGARLNGLRARPSLPHGLTHGPHHVCW